ncbi:MAG: hypothetical protein H6Q82_454, partial [Deltaproteobacteria bacterium]|nr:hypothetical protein [Deltaproteobacteria bacterium]
LPGAGAQGLLRPSQGGLGGVQRRTVRERLADPSIQRFGAEQLPPLCGDLPAGNEALRPTADPRRNGRLRRQCLSRVGRNLGGGRPAVIWADRTTGERHSNDRRIERCKTLILRPLQWCSPERKGQPRPFPILDFKMRMRVNRLLISRSMAETRSPATPKVLWTCSRK